MGKSFDPRIVHERLSNDSLLTIKMVDIVWDSDFEYGEEVERGELEFFIEGRSCSRNDLPGEVTDQVIDKLVASATFDPEWSFGGPDQ